MPPQAIAVLATLLSAAQDGNRVELRLDRGAAEVVWVSERTFRFRRTLEGPLPKLDTGYPAVRIQIDEIAGAIRLRTRVLEVRVRKSGVLIDVRAPDGTPLMSDVSEPRAAPRGIEWERGMERSARYYGLGPRTDAVFDLRGKQPATDTPFLLSTAGYGEYHASAGTHRFDFTAPDRYRITAPAIDYYFYFGPTPKRIFEEHRRPQETWQVPQNRIGSWASLQASLPRLVHASLSGITRPAFDLRLYTSPPELPQRARQLGSLVPGTIGERSGFRQQLESFYRTYEAEREHKGYPVWHPLPFQFPDDPGSALHTDEFLLGDEMLIAPIVTPGGKRSLYLPPGTWTQLETNRTFPGRQTIEVATESLPVFARNGTIIPLDSAGGIGLHYFPSLGAEFYLLEADLQNWTSIHAAPAADAIRLQIESRIARDYQWVVHHIEQPAAVRFDERVYREVDASSKLEDRTWFYDKAQKNLHIRVKVAAGEDCVINLSF